MFKPFNSLPVPLRTPLTPGEWLLDTLHLRSPNSSQYSEFTQKPFNKCLRKERREEEGKGLKKGVKCGFECFFFFFQNSVFSKLHQLSAQGASRVSCSGGCTASRGPEGARHLHRTSPRTTYFKCQHRQRDGPQGNATVSVGISPSPAPAPPTGGKMKSVRQNPTPPFRLLYLFNQTGNLFAHLGL